MRSKSVALAAAITVLAAAGAVGCFLRAADLRRDAGWLLERANAQAQEYASTFESAVAERQLQTFEERRAVLERAHLWQRGQMLLILLAVVGAFSSYVLYLFHRLRHDLEEVEEDSLVGFR